MHSALSRRRRSRNQATLKCPKSSTAEPKWQCKFCLSHCNPGVTYCVCGRLMTTDSAENRKYISSTLDSFSIPSFYIRKDRPRGHRSGKAPGCKEYHTANQLAKKCHKREYDSIHDRYIRDKAFRKAMIDHGRTEQMIIENGQACERGPQLQSQQGRKSSSTVAIGGSHSECGTR